MKNETFKKRDHLYYTSIFTKLGKINFRGRRKSGRQSEEDRDTRRAGRRD